MNPIRIDPFGYSASSGEPTVRALRGAEIDRAPRKGQAPPGAARPVRH
ncbi:hypothetical protein [Saccharopolyspora sp. ASAGF58]|nr:hypothetical protein [Saccharopolyspora sp. ASAGF58]